jgi:hypothetical protein
VVVHLAGHGNTVWARHEIGAGTAVREHLHGNAGLVHRLQSSLADLGQEFERVRAVRRCLSRPEAPPPDCAWIDSADQGWNRKMLFERHDTHWQFLRLPAYHIPLPQSLGRCTRRRGPRDFAATLSVLRARWRLRGVKPEDIPVEEPAKFDLVVNLKTAKAIGLTIPESFLTRAEVCRPSSCPSAVEASSCSGVL